MKGRGINKGRGSIIDFLRFHLILIIKIQAEDSEQVVSAIIQARNLKEI
jgi:hypothetical protein